MDLHERLAGLRPESAPGGGDPFAEIKNRIHLTVIGDLGPQLFTSELNPVAMRERVLTDVRAQLEKETTLARADRERLPAEIADDILGHGPLERLLADDTVTEIMVNGPSDIWVERPEPDQVAQVEPLLRELPDRHERPRQGERRQHRVHAAAVG